MAEVIKSFEQSVSPTGNGNYNEIINFIRLRLGHPRITVELLEEHYITAIEEAIEMWTQLVGDERTKLVKEMYLNLTPGTVSYPIEDPEFDYVISLSEGSSHFLGIPGADNYLLYWNSRDNQGFFRDIADFYIKHGFLETAKRTIGADKTWEVINTPAGRKLNIYPTPMYPQHVYVRYALKLKVDDFKDWNIWIKKYALAVCKGILGEIRGKYTSGYPVAMNSGGGLVSLNGSELTSAGKEEIEKLEAKAANYRGVIYAFFG